MNQPSPASRLPARAGLWLGASLLIVAVVVFFSVRRSGRDDALLRAGGEQLQADAVLLSYATERAEPLYRANCASCHGANLQGDRSKGVPNLADNVWLYGTGQITDIEQTILYGIRSGHPKSHNLAVMPGLGRLNQLTKAEVHDVVEYVLQLSHQPHDSAAATRGQFVFDHHGGCFDCHGSDGDGVSDYGTPALNGRGGSWLYGGDRDTLYKSTFDGRHGLCPAWIHKLSFTEIRALAAFLYSRSHGEQPSQNANPTQSAGT